MKIQTSIGKKYGEWTILEHAGFSRSNHPLMRARCSCGLEKDVLLYSVTGGRSKSCLRCARKKVIYDNPVKRLLRELRDRVAIDMQEATGRGRLVVQTLETLCSSGLATAAKGKARLTAKGVAHATSL